MKKRMNGFDYLNYAAITGFSISILLPFWNLLMVSFSYPIDAMDLNFKWWPKQFTLDSYNLVFKMYDVWIGYMNTIIRTVVGTALSLMLTLLAAYALSNRNLPLRNTITIFFLVTMFFSGGLIPNYLLIKGLHLIDSRLALILPVAFNVFYMIIMRNYMQTSIDKSFSESAAIDGANEFQILYKVIIPLCTPILATVSLWTIVGHWNAWFDALIYINSPEKDVLQVMLRKAMYALEEHAMGNAKAALGIGINDVNPETMKAAFIFLTITPIILTYPFLQKYFVKGIVIGSLKG